MQRGDWPALPLEAWRDCYATLHRWLQIAGKVQLALTPWVNHSWHVTFRPTARGLASALIPFGSISFQIEFDFLEDRLVIATSEGGTAAFPLAPQSVAAFHRRFMRELEQLGLRVRIHGRPSEIAEAIPFADDETHSAYDGEYARRFWRILVSADRVLTEFRARFRGKCSPVHFFWGAADLAVTRFSGRPAPLHPGGVPGLPDWVTQEAYSHEVSSAGFWPGSAPIEYPAFYSYAYPEPPGFGDWRVGPDAAFYSTALREFILPYDAIRESATPESDLLAFLQSTYEAAAELGKWDRAAVEV